MSCETAIRLDGVGKCYPIYANPRDRLIQMFARGQRKHFREFWALKDVSIDIRRGETVGVIGRNGSGKSTLLQIVCGTLSPSAGSVETRGRIAALLELGAGFNPDFSGRENVFLSAALYGLEKSAIESRFDDIAAFADIGDFLDQPVRTYSSGMFVRLAFAVIAHVQADILVIDEALAVGDAYFVQKCMRFLRDFMAKGTLLLCSHDLGAVTNLCGRAMLLDKGSLVMTGTPKVVAERYHADLYGMEQRTAHLNVPGAEARNDGTAIEYRDMRTHLINASPYRNDIELFAFDPGNSEFGTGHARVTSVRLLDQHGSALSWVVGGENVTLEIRCRTDVALLRPIVGFTFKDRLGQPLFVDNTYLTYHDAPPPIPPKSTFLARFSFSMPILPAGEYSISPAIADGTQDEHVQHHWLHDALVLRVHASTARFGLVGIPMREIFLGIDQTTLPQ